MQIEFWKMHGAGNDFILIDDRDGMFPLSDAELVRSLCRRRTGVGCEGLILLQESGSADIRMRFLNPDGSEVEMCGNGARCLARLAHDLGVCGRSMLIETSSGILRAETDAEDVCLHMTNPGEYRTGLHVHTACGDFDCDFMNTGVPHVVVRTANIGGIDVLEIGSALRYHDEFAPDGTNVNFVSVEDEARFSIRTYERGVEGETMACGTGVVASALCLGAAGLVKSPVDAACAGGYVMSVSFENRGAVFENVRLRGPAQHVYRGVLDTDLHNIPCIC